MTDPALEAAWRLLDAALPPDWIRVGPDLVPGIERWVAYAFLPPGAAEAPPAQECWGNGRSQAQALEQLAICLERVAHR